MSVVPRSGAFGAVSAGLVLSGALAWPQPSSAGQWRATPSISLSETYSDNSRLARENEDRDYDLISVISPGVSVIGSGGRINLNFDYSLQKTIYLQDTASDSLRNALLGGGRVELWDRVLFLRGQASISRQVVDAKQRSSSSVAGQNINSATVRTVNLVPEFRHHFGDFADADTSVTYSRTDTTDANTTDTNILSEQLHVGSGRRFTVMLWSLDVNNSKTRNDGTQPAELRRHIDGTFTYVYSPRLSLLGGAGWQQVKTNALNSQPVGATWKVGFTARPGPLTSFGLTYGDRDGKRSFDVSAKHQFSAQTSISATYAETLQTTGGQLSQNLSNLSRDPNTNAPIDVNTNLPFVAGDNTFGLENNAFRQRRLSIGWRGTRQRTSFGGNIFYEIRDFQRLNITEKGYGLGLNLGRQHTSRLNSAFNLNYRRLDPDRQPNTVEDEGTFASSLSYQVTNTVSAVMGYTFTVRRVRHARDDFHENSVTISLRKTF